MLLHQSPAKSLNSNPFLISIYIRSAVCSVFTLTLSDCVCEILHNDSVWGITMREKDTEHLQYNSKCVLLAVSPSFVCSYRA